MWSDNSMKWVVVLLCCIGLNLGRSIIQMIQSWLHGTVLQSLLNITPMDIVFQCSTNRGTPTSNIGHIFQEFDMVFLLEKTPTSYIQWQSLSCHMLAYASSACLYGIATPLSCTMYVLCNNTYRRVGCTFKRKGPFATNFWLGGFIWENDNLNHDW